MTTENQLSYDGEIINNIYTFPQLISYAKNNKKRIFQIYIMLYQQNKLPPREHNWFNDKVRAKCEPIKQEYCTAQETVPQGVVAIYFTRTGQESGKQSYSEYTEIKAGKVKRTIFTQALLEAQALYNKKMHEGFRLETDTEEPKIYYAMAAATFTEKIAEKFEYPVYSQPKLDGIRCLLKISGNKCIGYTRDHQIIRRFPFMDAIEEMARAWTARAYDIYLDGELYDPKLTLQKIISIVRNSSSEQTISFYMFDAFIASEDGLNRTFPERFNLLKSIYKKISLPRDDMIKVVETTKCNTRAELDSCMVQYIDDDLEGQIIRLASLKYETSTWREIRSQSLIKRKLRQSDEYKLVGFKAGEGGRMKGAFIGEFEVSNSIESPKPTFFASCARMTINEQKELYKIASDYIGKLATIEFERLSDSGVPLKPKFIAFRDYDMHDDQL